MKKYNLFFAFIIGICMLSACGGGNNQGANKNTDVFGEADSLSPHKGRASENIAKATINGREVEFKFMDSGLTISDSIPFSQSADSKYTSFSFELGSDAQLREKIGITLINHNIGKDNLPFKVEPTKQEGKQAKLDLSIQKSSVFINYNNTDGFTCSITKFNDSEIEGNFFGDVRNSGGRTIKVENGYFKVAIKKIEMKLQ
ncbi:MAG: hypothetical protein MUE81_11550 [Thermoflexibacter sp.]|jgi:hypothetical protein|nr:hypothetical protein [Thermoflexibacter sp.]